MRSLILHFLVVTLLLGLFSCASSSESIDDIGLKLKHVSVYDQVGVLQKEQVGNLENIIKSKERSNQDSLIIKCAVLKTFQPVKDNMHYSGYLMSLADKESYNLVYIVFFTEDRNVVIRTNDLAMKRYSDSTLQKTIDAKMIPFLKKEKYYEAFVAAISEL